MSGVEFWYIALEKSLCKVSKKRTLYFYHSSTSYFSIYLYLFPNIIQVSTPPPPPPKKKENHGTSELSFLNLQKRLPPKICFKNIFLSGKSSLQSAVLKSSRFRQAWTSSTCHVAPCAMPKMRMPMAQQNPNPPKKSQKSFGQAMIFVQQIV